MSGAGRTAAKRSPACVLWGGHGLALHSPTFFVWKGSICEVWADERVSDDHPTDRHGTPSAITQGLAPTAHSNLPLVMVMDIDSVMVMDNDGDGH